MKKFIFYLFNAFIWALFLLVKWIFFTFKGNLHSFYPEELALSYLLICIFFGLMTFNLIMAYKETKK